MRLITLAAMIIVLFCSPVQAMSLCQPPAALHTDLIRLGYVPFAHMMTDQGFLLTIYIADNIYVVTAEDAAVACIVASGEHVYFSKGFNI